MTAVLSVEIALELIASHGADPARWPADQRAGLLALAAADADVAAALVDARALDAQLAGWAKAPLEGAGIDIATILALPQDGAAAPRRANGWRPALLAASLALVVAVGGWLGLSGQMTDTGPQEIAAASPSAGASASEVDDGFAYVFTPTAAEEDLI
ncbi:hypothetical protein [Sandarakinorhabdus oryzae]|uniref:hypothetical protein n=1 Tax=Sandarakinorhabdus oryzae TaxID=2675220 RepID=UPI0012E1A624|nr:hypothetical protein [Sandarakinorhabdus oryzae]